MYPAAALASGGGGGVCRVIQSGHGTRAWGRAARTHCTVAVHFCSVQSLREIIGECARRITRPKFIGKRVLHVYTGTYDFLVLLLFSVYEWCARSTVCVYAIFVVPCVAIIFLTVRSPAAESNRRVDFVFSPFVASRVPRRRYTPASRQNNITFVSEIGASSCNLLPS